ncbi:MAG: M1 family aminopeptidase [Vicinamibacterales bacterium]
MRRFTLVAAFASLLLAPSLLHAQTPDDGLPQFLSRIEALLRASDGDGLAALVSPLAAPDVTAFTSALIGPGVSRAVVKERDRLPLEGAPAGEGYSLIVELFTETADRARIVTARLDVRRPLADDTNIWRIQGGEQLTSVEGLYRLRVDETTQFAARELVVESEDLRLTLHEGTVFQIDSSDGVTGLVLLGQGEMRFSPAPETEKGQLRIFAGAEVLATPFESAFVRFSPTELAERFGTMRLQEVAVDPRQLATAQDIFAEESPKSYSLDLSDLSREVWYLMPQTGDFLADVRTRRHGVLTYSKGFGQAEDIAVYDRSRRRTIALYASAERLATRGRFFSEDDFTDYDIVDYALDASIAPDRQFIDGRARMTLRIKTDALSTLTLRLAENLVVTGLASTEHGRLLYIRVRNQNSLVINLPEMLRAGSELTLLVRYSGRVDSEVAVPGAGESADVQVLGDTTLALLPEPYFLLSNQTFWYPQAPYSDYSTATLRITVPDGYGCVASGELSGSSDLSLQDLLAPRFAGRPYVFRATRPIRYFSVVISRFVDAGSAVVDLPRPPESDQGAPRTMVLDAVQAGPGPEQLQLSAEANPRQVGRAREALDEASAIMAFYTSLVGEAPYPALTLAMVESDLPGGHSPGYAALVHNTLPSTPIVWRNDPAAFSGFREFFVAHELAHQWWGQAVGWKNYHEQWLSEGLAQYFAALYAEKAHGEDTFEDMLRQFRRWSLSESDEGPVYLGYRLGHIRDDPRVFRALVYNKGAAVLHMLRRLLGDEAFFRGIRLFYAEQRFRKAGTDDLIRAFEEASGRSLGTFFEQWIFGSDLPQVRYRVERTAGEVLVTFQQDGAVFELPVTVTLTYTDGRVEHVVVPVNEATVERRIPASGVVRRVQVNRDSAALADLKTF